MTAIPFGASYFSMQWNASAADGDQAGGGTGGNQDSDIHGTFPLPGKVALGIRMCFLATSIGQIALTFATSFPILFCCRWCTFLHTLCYLVIQEQGYTISSSQNQIHTHMHEGL